ncbi:hypothetical protein DFQ14_103123 [Halopolyspora algeriensis]|uniref:Uncharacterized protein n=1 Tax=Halopolyspora algeriensis TaxID=1500506 RepID=A0A368VTS2_9ACTN|nr:hypothetical protein [Halopolyspora algeriensis]RCW45159.1 hypothetical protein DFQ14_103123 [Halopolyspora algeriensis]TQM53122.1 hypothetical protein FHU43_2501 [Halopolyspora algeriensis]
MSSTEATDTSSGFPLTFSLQPGFEPIDFTETPQQRAEKLLDSLQNTLPGQSGEQYLRVILAYEYSIQRMLEEGALYAANFVGRSARDPSAATTAQLTVLTRDTALKASQPLTVLARQLREERSGREVDFVDLSVGRCLAVVQEDLIIPEVNLTDNPPQNPRRTRQFQVVMPLASRGQLVFFTLATECLRDWDEYVAMMAEICKTITWNEPQQSSIASRLEGRL